MTQGEREKLEETAKIAKRQAEELSKQIEVALDESDFQAEYYGELRGMIYRFVTLAQQQMEERLALYEIIRKSSSV